MSAIVIWMHGLGDTPAGWSSLGREFRADFPHIQWVFPAAPIVPVTINNGNRMPSWFDIDDLPITNESPDDPEGMSRSVGAIHEMIHKLKEEGVSADRIVVGGFSQGAAVALHSILRFSEPLAGAVMFSGWAVQRENLSSLATEANSKPNVLVCHGTEDDKVSFTSGRAAKDMLEGMGASVEWREYDGMSHSSCRQEMSDLKRWLSEHLPATE